MEQPKLKAILPASIRFAKTRLQDGVFHGEVRTFRLTLTLTLLGLATMQLQVYLASHLRFGIAFLTYSYFPQGYLCTGKEWLTDDLCLLKAGGSTLKHPSQLPPKTPFQLPVSGFPPRDSCLIVRYPHRDRLDLRLIARTEAMIQEKVPT